MEKEQYRIQDDLYNNVNGKWLEEAIIPDDRPTTGGFAVLDQNVEKIMMNDFNLMASGSKEIIGDNLKKAVKLYSIANNVKKRNKDGFKPLEIKLSKLLKMKSMISLNKNLKELILDGITLPFDISVDTNMKDALHYCLAISGPGVILPDTTYYKEEMKAQRDALISLWTNMASSLLAKSKLSKEDQELFIKDTIEFDSRIATLVKSSEEWSNYTEAYNPMKAKKVFSMVKPFKLENCLNELYDTIPEEIIVQEPRYFKNFKTIFTSNDFSMLIHWSYVKTVVSNSPLLSEELRLIAESYQNALMGVATSSSIEKQAYNIASHVFSEPVGLYYGRTYFGEEAKADVVDMVKEIIETYKKRMASNSILCEETKLKAIEKLNKIAIKMGYPDNANKLFDSFEVDDQLSLFDNLAIISRVRRIDRFSKLYKNVDRNEWLMPGHMVNACYDPFRNDITFPAAILQAPFYSIKQTRSQNLGGIGAVIGHEISHAFDNNGAKFDENGNLNDWWTKEDIKKFKACTNKMIKQFDGIEIGDSKVNGAFVVSENIADNGGVGVTLDIMGNTPNSNYQEYFINWAKIWCQKAKPEYAKLLLSIDVHSPNCLRANIPPRNFAEWYKTFNVTSKDKMYIAPSKRIIIW